MSGLPLKADFLIARSGHHQADNSGMAAKGANSGHAEDYGC
jgi:hypothetical protein